MNVQADAKTESRRCQQPNQLPLTFSAARQTLRGVDARNAADTRRIMRMMQTDRQHGVFSRAVAT